MKQKEASMADSKIIYLTKNVHDLVKEYPELIPIMKELGFTRITEKTALNTLGRFMTIPKGAMMMHIDMGKVISTLMAHGFTLGGTADAHAKAAADGLLEAYKSPNAGMILPEYQDKDGYWYGTYLEVMSIGYNEKRFKEEFEPKGVKAPETLEDLLKPEFKGEIIMPDPRKSGTGNTFISSVLQQKGPEKGWAYLKALKPQVAQFTPSGFTPGQKTGAGEYLVCLNFISDQTLVSAKGQKIHSTIYDQAGWTTCPVGKIKNHANDEAAKAFIDFVLTKEAGDILVKTTHGVACNPDVAPPEGMKPLKELPLFKEYDLIKAGADKQKNCDEFFAD